MPGERGIDEDRDRPSPGPFRRMPFAPVDLNVSSNPWKGSKMATTDSDDLTLFCKAIQCMLNKLSPRNFDSICQKFCNEVQSSVVSIEFLHEAVRVLFDKALTERKFVRRYSDLAVAGKANVRI
eukprot:965131_1